jgi:hypothetical protein
MCTVICKKNVTGRVIGCGGSGGARGLAGGRGSRAGGWGAGLLAYRRGAIAVDDARDPSDLLLHGEQFGGDEVGELLDLRGCLGRGGRRECGLSRCYGRLAVVSDVDDGGFALNVDKELRGSAVL